MHIVRDLKQVRGPAAVALGNFDGVHRGHQQVLQPVLEAPDAVSTVLTFDPHPRQVLEGKTLNMLTPLPERLAILESLGLEQVVLIPFTREFATQSPQAFITTVLERSLRCCRVSVGGDFCFGAKRAGNTDLLQEWGQASGVDVRVIPSIEWHGQRISSSRIRSELADGHIETANLLLSRPYQLQGCVVEGDRRGRELGFPTANVEVTANKVLPRDGVYSGQAWWQADEREYSHHVVLNIGKRPTFAGVHRTVEVHLLDWSGDLYGTRLAVDLKQFIRPEQKFASLADLKAQLHRDCDRARQLNPVSSLR